MAMFYLFSGNSNSPSRQRVIAESLDDVEMRDAYGNTVLHWAADGLCDELIEELITRGADVDARNDKGQTPLHRGAKCGPCHSTVNVLIAHGADVNARASDGATPLDVAVQRGRSSMIDLLRNHGARTSSELDAAAVATAVEREPQ